MSTAIDTRDLVMARVLPAVARRVGRTEHVTAGLDEGDSQARHIESIRPLTRALISSKAEFENLLARTMARLAISRAQIVDDLVPEIARELGDGWMENRYGFTEVTVACGRLMELVRDIGRGWHADSAGRWDAANVCLFVTDGEQHTLGALVAASWFRRQGVSVQVLMGLAAADAARRIASSAFDMVALTVGSSESLEPVASAIDMIRAECDKSPPIVVGGAIRASEADVRAWTGADHFTNDPAEALRLCGIAPANTARARSGG